MTDEQLQKLLKTAIHAAEEAGKCIKTYFDAQQLSVTLKSDGSPVTAADQEAEALIRSHLLKASVGPLDILGEEQGLLGQGTRWRWTVDPIDGTRSFIHGIPLFGTMIALQDTQENRPLLGVIHLPMLGHTYAGARGQGATFQGKTLRLPQTLSFNDAVIGTGDVSQFVAARRYQDFQRLCELSGFTRTYTDCFGHGLAIRGALGAMMDVGLDSWDILPAQLLIEEAGGTILMRPSHAVDKIDALFGNREVVQYIARMISF